MILAVLTWFTVLSVTSSYSLRSAFHNSYWEVVTEAECSCNCCIGEPRRPSEVDGPTVMTKCAAMPVHDEQININNCIPTCAVVNDAVLHNSHVVELDQFCFYHCQPTQSGYSLDRMQEEMSGEGVVTGGALTDSICVPLTTENTVVATIADGNGRDHEADVLVER